MQDEPDRDPQPIQKEAVSALLKRWFSNVTGQALVSIEKEHLDEVLPNLFGYHIVQIGELTGESLMSSSRISHQVLLSIDAQDATRPEVTVCRSSQLPIETNCVDVVLLHHVLEFEQDPHEVLREIERILIGEGHIVILGFNPVSWWGFWRLLLAWRGEPPWSGRFFRLARISDWLGLLGFDIIKTQTMYFRPPTSSGLLVRRLAFLEKLGNYAFRWFGATYLIVAKKRLLPLTPTKTLWRTRRHLISAGITEARLGSINENRYQKSNIDDG